MMTATEGFETLLKTMTDKDVKEDTNFENFDDEFSEALLK